jgi:hypothetical protein
MMAGAVYTAGAAVQSAMGMIDRCGRASHIYGSAHPGLVHCGNSLAADIEDGRLAVHVRCEASKSNAKVSGSGWGVTGLFCLVLVSCLGCFEFFFLLGFGFVFIYLFLDCGIVVMVMGQCGVRGGEGNELR